MDNDALGDRMKNYENSLMLLTYIVMLTLSTKIKDVECDRHAVVKLITEAV